MDRRSASPEPFNLVSLPNDHIVERYRSGEPYTHIAKAIGVASGTVLRRLRQAGVPIRGVAEATTTPEIREKVLTAQAEHRRRKVGRFEDVLGQWLEERGELPDYQRPCGTRSIDLAISPIAVEVWLSTSLPFADPYCRRRIKDLSNRGWSSVYVFIARRTNTLLPVVADQIVALAQETRRDPPAARQHWVIRGCGELAAIASDDLDDFTVIPPSVGCPYHSCVNRRLRQ